MKSRRYLLLACLIAAKGLAQQGPQPGDIYREYAVNLKSGDNWRVTDPNARNPGAAEFMPNPVLSISIDDLEKAVRAEVLMDIWEGHPGTSGMKFRFNANDWIDIPRAPTLISRSECYMAEYNVILDLPLEYLQVGENAFQGSSGRQVCNDFNWGQWGWYVMMVRIYYQPDKAHTGGQIVQPVSGDTIEDNPIIKIVPSDTGSVSLIQILGHYYGYDENGDGIYQDWHRAYHGVEITGHIGTMEESPYQHRWSTRYLPDQEAGAVSLLARIRDTSGIWYVTDVVDSLTLQRPDSLSVRMHRATAVQERFWVRAGQTKHCYVNIVDPAQGMEAVLVHRTWNGGDDEAAGGSINKPLLVNGHSYKCYGKNHFFALSSLQVAMGDLKPGQNRIAYRSDTEHHGIEVLWPGPAILVRYVHGGDTLAIPTFSPPDGHTFEGTLNLSILNQTEGSKIYYTTDGTDPNPSDERYRGQNLQTRSDITFKARAFKRDHFESKVVTATYTLNLTRINELQEENLRSYPNPASDRIFLNLPPGMENGNYSIIDLQGRVVATGRAKLNEISLGQMTKGVYFLKYESTQQILTAKFIVFR